MQYLPAVYSADTNWMFNTLTDILVPSDETGMDAFRADFLAEIRPCINQS